MITSVRIRDALRESTIKLPVYSPSPDQPFFITDVQGLGPVKADLMSSDYANVDGGIIHSTRVPMRNIILKVRYSPFYAQNQSSELIRQDLYNILPPKAKILLVVNDNELERVHINGVVESHEPTIFTKTPEVQISIVCPAPYFRLPTPKKLYGTLGYNLDVSGITSVETGFIFNFRAERYTEAIRIANGLQQDIYYGKPLDVGDRLKISTIPGNKYLNRNDGSGYYSDLDGLEFGDMGMYISPTMSTIKVTGRAHDPQNYDIEITPQVVGL